MKRLDKYMTDLFLGTRSQVKDEIKKGSVTVNGCIVRKPEHPITPQDCVFYRGEMLPNQEFYYYMLYKPQGVVTAVTDAKEKTVLDLIAVKDRIKGLYPVGRLDKDTEGLLILTNDGPLGHKLLSPSKHVKKTYYVKTRFAVSKSAKKILQNGVDIGEKKKTLPAVIIQESEDSLYITITEGKYHQIKRMFESIGNEVIFLKRISMGSLRLDSLLNPGEYRPLTSQELQNLQRG